MEYSTVGSRTGTGILSEVLVTVFQYKYRQHRYTCTVVPYVPVYILCIPYKIPVQVHCIDRYGCANLKCAICELQEYSEPVYKYAKLKHVKYTREIGFYSVVLVQ
jgi:hypothetical protein